MLRLRRTESSNELISFGSSVSRSSAAIASVKLGSCRALNNIRHHCFLRPKFLNSGIASTLDSVQCRNSTFSEINYLYESTIGAPFLTQVL